MYQRKKTCPRHGEYIETVITLPHSNRQQVSGCPMCFLDHNQTRACEDQAAMFAGVKKNNDQVCQDLGVPLRLKNATFENYICENPNQKKAFDVSKRFSSCFRTAKSYGANLIFYGNMGNGKSHLAAAITKNIYKAGFTARYASAEIVCDEMRRFWYAKKIISEQIKFFCKKDFMVIDEVGLENENSSDDSILSKILLWRYEKMRPTLIISNCHLADKDPKNRSLSSIFGGRLIERLIDGNSDAIHFDWKSYRRRVRINWDQALNKKVS